MFRKKEVFFLRSASDIGGIKDFKVEVEFTGKIPVSYL